MSVNVTVNGIVYPLPTAGENVWGTQVTNFFIGVASGTLQKTGGTFALTGNVNFGANYGLLSKFYSTRAASPSATGLVRLAVADFIAWRDNADGADLTLGVNALDQLVYDGNQIVVTATAIPADMGICYGNNVGAITTDPTQLVWDYNSNSMGIGVAVPLTKLHIVDNGQAVRITPVTATSEAYLNIQNGTGRLAVGVEDSGGGAIFAGAPAYSAVFGTLSNTPVALGVNGTIVAILSTAGLAVTGNVTATAFVGDVTGDVIGDLTGNVTGNVTGDVIGDLTGNVTGNVTGNLTGNVNGNVTGNLTGNVTGNVSGNAGTVTTNANLTGPVTSVGNATAVTNNAITNAMLAQMATITIKGNSTGGLANASDLSVTTVTSMLNAVVGDSGAGGTKGLVPAPAAGDTAAGKFLKADGTWTIVPSAGITDLTGDVLGTGPGSTATTIAANAVSNAKFRQSAALTVVGNSTNALANVADIAAGTDKFVLRRNGTALGFGLLDTTNLSLTAGITFSQLAALTSAHILVGSAGNVATSVAVTGDITLSNAGVTAVAAIAGVAVGGVSGTGNVAFTNSPSFTTPTLGVASATSINKVGITAPASSATLTIQDGMTLSYEQGTWNAAFSCSTSGTISGTATGLYTRIGRVVTLSCLISSTAISSPLGVISITGLPYASSGATRQAISIAANGLAVTAVTSIIGFISSSASSIILQKYSAGALSNIDAEVTNNMDFYIGGTYHV